MSYEKLIEHRKRLAKKRPKRDPDIQSDATEIYYRMMMWLEEGIVGFCDREGSWKYFYKVRISDGAMTAYEYLEYLLRTPSHPHHHAAASWVVENEILRS